MAFNIDLYVCKKCGGPIEVDWEYMGEGGIRGLRRDEISVFCQDQDNCGEAGSFEEVAISKKKYKQVKVNIKYDAEKLIKDAFNGHLKDLEIGLKIKYAYTFKIVPKNLVMKTTSFSSAMWDVFENIPPVTMTFIEGDFADLLYNFNQNGIELQNITRVKVWA